MPLAADAPLGAHHRRDLTPHELALRRCSNGVLDRTAKLGEALLGAGADLTSRMKEPVARLGVAFEFHRANFKADTVDTMSGGLERLYMQFEVPPVPHRMMHDGISPIITAADDLKERYQELWARLLSSTGAASTVQGEAIRIADRIALEIDRDCGLSWDTAFRQMAKAWLAHVGIRAALAPDMAARAGRINAWLSGKVGHTEPILRIGYRLGDVESTSHATRTCRLRTLIR